MKNCKRKYTKIALALSICIMIMWALLGTGTSLAWFTDTTPTQKNIFNIGELDLVVSKRLDNGDYDVIDSEEAVFDENALYEPGYVQVVYLKVENKGDIPFDYKTAVTVTDFTPAYNVFGTAFNLQDYLKFGVVTADTYEELVQKVKDREAAKANAEEELKEYVSLNTYYTEVNSLEVDGEDFVAIIVRMPEEVNNVANHSGTPPKVELGITVTASQQGTLN